MTIAVLGEALIDFIAGRDGAFRPHLGGSPYNVAIGLARQGIDTSYVSPFSDDTFGDQLHEALRHEGVSLPVERRSRWPTSLALVTIDALGKPTYRLYREGIADKDISFEEVAAALPKDLKIFHTGSLAITPSQLPKVRQLLETVRSRGALVSIDVNVRLGASIDAQAYLEGVRSLTPAADIVKASEEDLEALGLEGEPLAAAETAHREMNGGILVLTEGRGGATLVDATGTIEKKAYPIAQVADTVGAGDTFHSAFLASLLRALDPRRTLSQVPRSVLANAVDYACAAAAINVSRTGCSPPTRDEVEKFIEASSR